MADRSWKEEWLFACSALKRYRDAGMLFPSSISIARGAVALLPVERLRKIVEIGSGTGRLTRLIADRLNPGARLYCVEKNPAFCDYLRENLGNGAVTVLNSPAEDLHRFHPEAFHPRADAVVLSLPSSMVPESVRIAWIRTAHALLEDGGYLLVHQFIPIMGRYLDASQWSREGRRRWFMGVPPFSVDVHRKRPVVRVEERPPARPRDYRVDVWGQAGA